MTTKIINKIFANHAHQVVADHFDVTLNLVIADVGIDGGKALSHGPGTLHSGFINQLDFQVSGGPLLDLKSGAASGHAAANN